MGGRTCGLRPEKDALQPFPALGGERRVGRHLHRARQRGRAAGADTDRFLGRTRASLRFGRQRGERSQAIGRSRGGRTTKIHALTDGLWRPVAFLLTGGNVADCTAGETLLEQLPDTGLVNGDKGYDSNAIRRQIGERGAFANIPPKANRIWKNCFSPFLYRDRNAIERMFCRIKDFRRIATRYDRKAENFLAAVQIAATVAFWL